jgi:hypothetical protein
LNQSRISQWVPVGQSFNSQDKKKRIKIKTAFLVLVLSRFNPDRHTCCFSTEMVTLSVPRARLARTNDSFSTGRKRKDIFLMASLSKLIRPLEPSWEHRCQTHKTPSQHIFRKTFKFLILDHYLPIFKTTPTKRLVTGIYGRKCCLFHEKGC